MSECNICKREGLPIFPVRSAVVPSHINSPAIPANFQVTVPLNVGGVHYSARPLRSGFLYVYLDFEHEMFNFIEYYITTEGYYSKVPQGQPWSSATVEGKKVCVPSPANGFADHRGKASLITVPLVDEGCAYFSWSEHRWSDELKEKYRQDETYRAQMQKLDIGACKNGGGAQANTASLSSLPQLVPEYNPQLLSIALDKMAFSCHDFVRKPPELAQVVIDSANQLAPEKGIMLHFQDPTGAATDIANWMEQVYQDKFFDPTDPDYARGIWLSSTIGQIEAMVKENARIDAVKAFDDKQNSYNNWEKNADNQSSEPVPEEDTSQPVLDAKYLDRVTSDKWEQNYLTCINRQQKEAFDAKYQADLTKLDEGYFIPLAKVHVKLMRSDCMTNYFHFNLPAVDNIDIRHGLRFIVTLASCIGQTFKYQACHEYYCASLAMSDKQLKQYKNNLLYKALTFNSHQIEQGLQSKLEGDGINITGSDLWTLLNDGLYDKILNDTDIMTYEKWEMVNQYLSTISRAATTVTIKNNVSPVVPMPIVAISAINGSQLYFINKKAGLGNMALYLVKLLGQFEGAPKTGAERDRFYNLMKTKLKELKISGIKMEGVRLYRFILSIDARQINRLGLNNKTADEAAQALIKLIESHTLEEIYALQEEAIKLRQHQESMAQQRQVRRSGQDFKGKVAAGVGSIAIIFQISSLTELLREDNEVTPDLKDVTRYKLYVSLVVLISSSVGLVESTKLGIIAYKKELGKLGMKTSKRWVFRASFVTAIGGIALAGFDIHSAYTEASKERYGLSFLYGAQGLFSGFAGFISLAVMFKWSIVAAASAASATAAAVPAGALAWAATPTAGFIIIIALVVLSQLVALLANNEIQNWLERCLWGILADDRYVTSKQEVELFEEALRKMRGEETLAQKKQKEEEKARQERIEYYQKTYPSSD